MADGHPRGAESGWKSVLRTRVASPFLLTAVSNLANDSGVSATHSASQGIIWWTTDTAQTREVNRDKVLGFLMARSENLDRAAQK